MSVIENPFVFFLLLLLPLYFLLKKYKIFSKPMFPLTMGDWKGQGFEWTSPANSVLRKVSKILFICAYVLLIISLSNPTIVRQERVYSSRSSEVVFVIDISPSMAAMDIANGTRLDAAKMAIEMLVNENKGSAFGLVSCASESALLVPPTMDHSTLFTQLELMRIGELGDETALGLGIATAVYHLVSTYAPRKTIVLLTDGENNAGSIHPETAAALAKDYNIALYIAGLGTRGSVPIEYIDPVSGQKYTGFLDSSFDNSSLRSLANMTDGKYFTVETLSSLSQALQVVSVDRSVAQPYYIKTIQEPLYTKTLLASALLFALAWIMRRLMLQEVL